MGKIDTSSITKNNTKNNPIHLNSLEVLFWCASLSLFCIEMIITMAKHCKFSISKNDLPWTDIISYFLRKLTENDKIRWKTKSKRVKEFSLILLV